MIALSADCDPAELTVRLRPGAREAARRHDDAPASPLRVNSYQPSPWWPRAMDEWIPWDGGNLYGTDFYARRPVP